MSENMVRTQVYLPRNIYERLQRRAADQALTLAVQIRTALAEYLERSEISEEPILRADDPIFELIGMASSQEGDLSVNHDHYLYGWPKREPEAMPAARQTREKQPPYRAKRKPAKSARGQK
jgi:hypothetical protein